MTSVQAPMRLLGSGTAHVDVQADDVGALVDHLRPIEGRGQPVLAVTSVAGAATAARTLSLARAGAPGVRGAVHASALPPLARRGLVEVLSSLAQRLPAGDLLVVAEAVERAMVAGAVLSSVTRLADPGPTMPQHLRSWWPGSSFIVVTHPRPAITVLSRGAAAVDALPEVVAPMFFACTGGDATSRAVTEQLAGRLTGMAAVEVATPADSRRRWGTGRFSEFSALPQDLTTLARTALDAADECRSCGVPVVWDVCRFCRAVRAPDEARDGARDTRHAGPPVNQTGAPPLRPHTETTSAGGLP